MRKLKNEELNRLDVEEFKNSDKLPLILILDNIRSLNNIGSIFRTADAFLVKEIILCGITAKPPHREIHKTALGATESVDWRYVEKMEDILSELRGNNYKIIAIEQADNSIMLNDFKPSLKDGYALIFGNEVHGVQEKIMQTVDNCIEIPQRGTKHSFNVSVSTGIVLWDISQKMRML